MHQEHSPKLGGTLANIHMTTFESTKSFSNTGKDQAPLVILIPTELNPRSHGHACLLELAKQLVTAHYPVYLLPYKPFIFFREYFPRIHPSYRKLPFIASISEVPGAQLLTPESSPPKLIRKLRQSCERVIWWLLAPSGLLTSFRPDIREGDYIAAFSEFALPRQASYLFIHPPTDPAIAQSIKKYLPQAPRRLQVSFYTGKGRLIALPRILHRKLLPYHVVPITREFPATRLSLVRLLESSNGLISYDPLTNLTLEAALIGTPSYTPGNSFPESSYQNFPADLSEFITDSAGKFCERISSTGPVRKMPEKSLFKENKHAITIVSRLTSKTEAEPFLATKQSLAEMESYRKMLIKSRTIQVLNNGQSVSAMFFRIYILTLKMPYGYHITLCKVLALIDEISLAFANIGLFALLWMFLNMFKGLAKKLRSMTKKTSPKLV
jgi:hypothetical protein